MLFTFSGWQFVEYCTDIKCRCTQIKISSHVLHAMETYIFCFRILEQYKLVDRTTDSIRLGFQRVPNTVSG